MNTGTLCRRVTEFGFALLGNGFALDAKQHKVTELSSSRRALSWVRETDEAVMVGNPLRLDDYLSLLKRHDYSYLMSDGGALQISYVFDGSQIERHRLAYYPCPFPVSEREIEEFGGGIIDFILDSYMDSADKHLLLRSPVRFDYAPEASSDFHPASHVTINNPDCRIPVRAPLLFDTFMKFVLENFYIEAWQLPKIASLLKFTNEPTCLSTHDGSRAYLNWAYPAS